jgi:hypothetical protein
LPQLDFPFDHFIHLRNDVELISEVSWKCKALLYDCEVGLFFGLDRRREARILQGERPKIKSAKMAGSLIGIGWVVAVVFLIFLVGALSGLLIGAAVCVRNIRQEMPARVAFSLHLLESRLGTLQSSVDQALLRWPDDVPAPRRERVLD